MIKAKRFWKTVDVIADGDGFVVALDARRVMTPMKSPMIVPTQTIAELVADEWRAVEGEIKPENMPFTKMANSAIEHVAKKHAEIVEHLSEYIDSDLICYRAAQPEGLVEAQKPWDEWIEWVRGFGINLVTTTSIMPVTQPAENRAAAAKWLSTFDAFKLGSVYEFITITGSFTFGMAIAEGAIEPQKGFALSRIDEDFQASIWGEDEEAQIAVDNKRRDVDTAMAFFRAATVTS